jgi:hypothetical protein
MSLNIKTSFGPCYPAVVPPVICRWHVVAVVVNPKKIEVKTMKEINKNLLMAQTAIHIVWAMLSRCLPYLSFIDVAS